MAQTEAVPSFVVGAGPTVRNGSATPRVGSYARKAEHPAVFGSRIHAMPETVKAVSAYAGQQMMAAKREL